MEKLQPNKTTQGTYPVARDIKMRTIRAANIKNYIENRANEDEV